MLIEPNLDLDLLGLAICACANTRNLVVSNQLLATNDRGGLLVVRGQLKVRVAVKAKHLGQVAQVVLGEKLLVALILRVGLLPGQINAVGNGILHLKLSHMKTG